MNLLLIGTALSLLGIAFMRSEESVIIMLGMLSLIIGVYLINKGRKQLGTKDK